MSHSDILREPVCIIIEGRAYSRRSTYYKKYQKRISQEAQKNVKGPSCESNLYVKIDYFYKKGEAIDADNLEHNVLDALKGVVYVDDRQVKETKTYLHQVKAGSIEYEEPFPREMQEMALEGSNFLGILVGKVPRLSITGRIKRKV